MANLAKGFHDQRYRDLIGKLVAERKRQKLSQDKLAALLGAHQQHVSRYETGERRLDVVEFADVAKALKLDVSDVLRDMPNKPKA